MKKNNCIKTTTLEAMVAISKTETGMDYVQVLPDNPRVGLVEPFHGMGYGQLLHNGTFDFTRRKRQKGKPELKTGYCSLSFCRDGKATENRHCAFGRIEVISTLMKSVVIIVRQTVINQEQLEYESSRC